jgi:hypothetical protein
MPKTMRNSRSAEERLMSPGGSIEVDWPLERALQIADQTVGVPVLEELYKQMRATPVSPNLDQLWKETGR